MLKPFESDTIKDRWGLAGEYGGIAYEPEFSERQANLLALAHNELGIKTFEGAVSAFPSLLDEEGGTAT